MKKILILGIAVISLLACFKNVDGLAEGYADGNSPTHSYDLEGNDFQATKENGNVSLNKGLLSGRSNLHLAGILFHEYRHAFQYFSPYTVAGKNYANRYVAWGELYGDVYRGDSGRWY